MSIGKRIALIFALALLLRGLVALGADSALEHLIQATVANTGLVEATVLSQSSLLTAAREDTGEEEVLYEFRYTGEEEDDLPHATPVPVPSEPPAPAEPLPALTLTGTEGQRTAAGIYVRNHTTYDIDVETLLAEPLSFDPASGGQPTVLILHTHGTESFQPCADYWYDNAYNFRTLDSNLNITRIGREMTEIFEARGIRVLHNQDIFDYPSFRGSYGRSLMAAEQYLAAHPEIQIVFDIHRDAIMDSAGNYVRTMAEIEGTDSAQVMLVVGTDHAGLHHPYWQRNLQFALRLQRAMVDLHPTFARPLALREERFNAHLTPGSVLVEIGTCGNTLQEALTASRLFAQLASDVILAGS